MRRSIGLTAAMLAMALALPARAAEPAPPALALAPAPAPAAAEPAADPLAGQVGDAAALIATGKSDEAIAVLDRVIVEEARLHAGETRRIYSARSLPETIMYMTMAAAEKRNAVALDRTWAEALFLKGFALVDLKRTDEAQLMFEQALAMSPLNARYLGELGEIHKARGQWDLAYETFSRAASAAELSPADVKDWEQARAWRGMGFALIELGRLDEAEQLFSRCLVLDPNDARAKNELAYIRQQRARAVPPPAS